MFQWFKRHRIATQHLSPCSSAINGVGTHGEEIGVEVQQGHEHEHQQHSATQLHVLLGRTLSHGGDSGEHALSFRTRLGQQQEQAAAEGEVSGAQGEGGHFRMRLVRPDIAYAR